MTKEHPNIITRDWRLQAITTLVKDFKSPWTGILHKAGSPVEIAGFVNLNNDLVQMPVPNPSAIYISLACRAIENTEKNLRTLINKHIRKIGDKNAISINIESEFFDELENLIACIVFSYTAIEAFANETIPDKYKFERMRGDKRCLEVYSKYQIERNINLDIKLDEILPQLCKVDSPKGTKAWEDYIWLKDIRDRYVHLKSSDWKRSSPESANNYVWTDLLSGKVLDAPKIALTIIQYYHKQESPRWLLKAIDQLK